MQQYNYLQAIYGSFYSRNLYRDVKQNWGAGVVFYLLLLLALCWIVAIIDIQAAINHSYSKLAANILPQLPAIKIKNGFATTPELRPYIIMDSELRNRTLVIDTSGQYHNLKEAKASVLLTQNALIIKDNDNGERILKIPKTLTVDLVPAQIKEKLSGIVHLAWILLFPVLLFLSLIMRLIQAVLYAILGKFFALLADNPLSYTNILKLSMVAVTPAVIIKTIFDWYDILFPFQWLLFFVLTMGYLIFAIRVNKD